MTASVATDRTIVLEWDDVAGASGYNIYETESPQGVGGNPVTESRSVRGPFGEERVYRYWTTSVVDGVESAPSAAAAIDYGTTPPVDPPVDPPTTGWKVLPAAGRSAVTDWTDSHQSGEPGFQTDGIHVKRPPTGGSPKNGANAAASGTQRIECYAAGADGFDSGHHAFRLDVELKAGFPADTGDWQLISQWKNNSTGSPPLSLEVRDGQFFLQWHNAGGDPVDDRALGRATVGKHQIVVDVTFSTSTSGSPVSAWLDGSKVLDAAKVSATCYSGQSDYWKFGLYRSSSVRQDAEVVFLGVAHGDMFGAVT